jgi:hypothetical protein
VRGVERLLMISQKQEREAAHHHKTTRGFRRAEMTVSSPTLRLLAASSCSPETEAFRSPLHTTHVVRRGVCVDLGAPAS